MKTKLHFLGADVPLTKSFSINSKGLLEKSPYPMVKRFTSYEEEVNSTVEFHETITRHAAQGHCLLKGLLDRPLVDESRAGHTRPQDLTNWMVLDVDGIDIEPERFLELIGLGNTNHIVQYSASAGVLRETDVGVITPAMNRYHIFLMLDQPQTPQALKLKLQEWNLTIPDIEKHLELTASKMSLRWALDITVCQNDKLIYIAPPTCGPGVIDTLQRGSMDLVISTQTEAHSQGAK